MEVKKEIKIEDKKSNVSLESRKRLQLTGVLEVFSFDDEKISLNTCLGTLTIKGKNLKMNKLDVQNGDVVIIGTIDSFVYSNSEAKQINKEGILARLFK